MKTALRINKNMWYSMCILFFNVKFLAKFRTVMKVKFHQSINLDSITSGVYHHKTIVFFI